MNALPAIAIGGPPHAGKSVLCFSLTQALRRRQVQHYVLRAAPDGEGDWANQADQSLVRAIRVKGSASPEWTERMCRDIARRHLPLIVDPGGKPTDWQEAIFDQCTHAILLCPDDPSHSEWLDRMVRHGLTVIADLKSDLHGENRIVENGAILRGTLAGLERGKMAQGISFDALVERATALFAIPFDVLREQHLRSAPTELVIELNRLGRTLNGLDQNQQWLPEALPRVLDYMPAAIPLALYDRAPNWLYVALALYARPASLYQFDARLGWASPPQLRRGMVAENSPLQFTIHTLSDHTRIEFTLRESYIDYADADDASVPNVPSNTGLVLSGKLPLWLLTGIALAYQDAPWLGIYQPQLHDRAVIVHSVVAEKSIGSLVYLATSTNK